MRCRAGVIIYCKPIRSVLLIHRKKDNKEYYVIPGGGLKNNESYEEAAKREIMEELGIKIQKFSEFFTLTVNNQVERYFISYSDVYENVEIQGEEEELKRSNPNNCYNPCWVNISTIQDVNLLPSEMKKHITKLN